MTPLETRILKANRKIQIMEEIHVLQMELFELQCDEILTEHRALSDFIQLDNIFSDFELQDPPKRKPKRKHLKPSAPKEIPPEDVILPKRSTRTKRVIKRKLFDGEPFESICSNTL